jgi:PAS domain-containing protein
MDVDGRMPSGRPDGFRDLMATLPVAVYTTDADGFFTSFNQAATDLAGRVPEIGRDRWCVTWRLYCGLMQQTHLGESGLICG